MIFTIVYDGSIYYGTLEGLGSAAESIMTAYLFSLHYGVPFYLPPIKKINHAPGNQEEWDLRCYSFIKDNLIQHTDVKDLPIVKLSRLEDINKNVMYDFFNLRLKQYNFSEIFNKWYPKLREDFLKKNISKEEEKIIAVHIRCFNRHDCDHNPDREYFNESKDIPNYFKNAILLLKEKYPDHQVHVYSQGTLEEFKDFQEFSLHLNEDAIESLREMILSDVLLMSKSSMSYIASYYSSGDKYIRETNFNSCVYDVKKISKNGTSFL